MLIVNKNFFFFILKITLQDKITVNQSLNGSATNVDTENLLSTFTNKSLEASVVSSMNFSIVDKVEESQNKQSDHENKQEVEKKIDIPMNELETIKNDYKKLKEIHEELEKRYITDLQLFSQQLQKANKELEDYKNDTVASNASKLQKYVDKCTEQDNELKSLKETITSLEQQVKKFEDNVSFFLCYYNFKFN